jgi:hypothetical protein
MVLLCTWKSLCIYTPLCEGKKEKRKRTKHYGNSIDVVICQYVGRVEYLHVRTC